MYFFSFHLILQFGGFQTASLTQDVCHGSFLESPLSWTCPETSSEDPCWTISPFDMEEEGHYSKSCPDNQTSHPKQEHSYSEGKSNFNPLYLLSCSFGHHLDFVTIGEGSNLNQPIDRKICLTAQCPQPQLTGRVCSIILLSLVNKTLKYLNSFSRDKTLPPTRRGQQLYSLLQIVQMRIGDYNTMMSTESHHLQRGES